MKQVNVTVRGTQRKVHIEKELSSNSWQARTYAGKKTVSGTLSKNSRGVYRFTPIGVNAQLV